MVAERDQPKSVSMFDTAISSHFEALVLCQSMALLSATSRLPSSVPSNVNPVTSSSTVSASPPVLLTTTCKRIGGPWGHEFRDACWANVIEAALPHHRQPAQSNTLEKGRHMVFHLLCLPTLIFIKMQVVFSSSSPQSSVLTSLDRDPSTWSQSATSQNRSPCLTQRSPPTLRLWSCASRWPC